MTDPTPNNRRSPMEREHNLIDLEVGVINRAMEIAILSDGQTVPIVNWYGAGGLECSPEEAVSCVCGPDVDGFWYPVDLSAFTGRVQ